MLDLSNYSFPQSNLSFINDNLLIIMDCFLSSPSSSIAISFTITNIFICLPFCTLILYHGVQQWRQKRSTSSAATTSHSDSFTFHMVTLMLIGVLGCALCCFGIYSVHVDTLRVGIILYCFTCFGEIFFQFLTCVERYLAVVHPITYLSLKNERGVKIRNISIVCVWLLSFVWTGLVITETQLSILNFLILFMSITIIPFFSLSVLCVLIRPGPGEQTRERVDRSKQRALYMMLAIFGVLLLRFAWNLLASALSTEHADCVTMTTGMWFNLPCTLLLPVLYVQKAGKCVCFRNNIQ